MYVLRSKNSERMVLGSTYFVNFSISLSAISRINRASFRCSGISQVTLLSGGISSQKRKISDIKHEHDIIDDDQNQRHNEKSTCRVTGARAVLSHCVRRILTLAGSLRGGLRMNRCVRSLTGSRPSESPLSQTVPSSIDKRERVQSGPSKCRLL